MHGHPRRKKSFSRGRAHAARWSRGTRKEKAIKHRRWLIHTRGERGTARDSQPLSCTRLVKTEGNSFKDGAGIASGPASRWKKALQANANLRANAAKTQKVKRKHVTKNHKRKTSTSAGKGEKKRWGNLGGVSPEGESLNGGRPFEASRGGEDKVGSSETRGKRSSALRSRMSKAPNGRRN